MNRKQLILLVAAGLVVGALGLILKKKDAQSWKASGSDMGRKILEGLPVNDVAQIVIRAGKGDLTLHRKDEVWRVQERYDYPGSFTEIADFLKKMLDLKAVQTVKVGASQLGRLELLPAGTATNTGTLVEFKDTSGKVLKSLLLGKKHVKKTEADPGSPFGGGGEWPDGRYVIVPGTTGEAFLVADPISNAEPKPETWVSKDFFKVEKIRSVAVTQVQATNSWRVYREAEGGELKLTDPAATENFDAAKASSIGNAFSFPSFVDVADPKLKPEETGLDKPVAAVIETFDGFKYTVRVGGKTGEDNQYLAVAVEADLPKARTPGKDEKPEDKDKLEKEFKDRLEKLKEKLAKEKALEKWVYIVSKWTVDPVLKERGQLMVDKKDDAKAGAAAPGGLPGGGIPGLLPGGLGEPKP